MNLYNLINNTSYLATKGSVSVDVTDLCQNVEKANKGSLFFCYKGVNFDGHLVAEKAKKRGAIALVVERFLDCDLPQILVKNSRKYLSKLCNKFFDYPTKKLKLIGVTGTNGKTTITHIIRKIFLQSGLPTGLVGTNGVYYLDKHIKSNLTTPDTIDLFRFFYEMQKSGIKYVVMEVSAHSLDLNKLYGIKFDVAIFSNLTQDHLDYFGSMHKYALAKLKFLKKTFCKNCIINTDDEYGKLFYRLTNANKYSYGISSPADNFAINIKTSLLSSSFYANVFDNVFDIKTNLTCLFNVYNILASIVCAKLFDIENRNITEALKNINVDGRVNVFQLKNNSSCVIDFAHTPDGLEKILTDIRDFSKNKIITVFGCGGDRDRTKRHIMGQVASTLSDIVIITNDNPRSEDPNKIISDITLDIKQNKNVFVEPSREKAIEMAYNKSSEGDLILVAGKGAEDYQEIDGKRYHFSDREIIQKYI